MSKFRNKYRIESVRRPNWDYSSNSLYFLTIITQYRVCYLGEIENDEMQLSDFGKIVENEWLKSFKIRNELALHEYILMPNHVHAIVQIKNANENYDIQISTEMPDGDVETHGRASLHPHSPTTFIGHSPSNWLPDYYFDFPTIKRNPPIRLPKSISSFIAGFKSAVNSKIDDFIDKQNLDIRKFNRTNHFFQPNYHDHIIRDDFEYYNIQNYIKNNPCNWGKDNLKG